MFSSWGQGPGFRVQGLALLAGMTEQVCRPCKLEAGGQTPLVALPAGGSLSGLSASPCNSSRQGQEGKTSGRPRAMNAGWADDSPSFCCYSERMIHAS